MSNAKTGYTLSRRWFDFAFERKEAKVQHTALFMWLVELNNRMGWKTEFGLPTQATMDGLSIGNRSTYISTLKDLQKWNFIKIVQESKNQYQSMIVTLCHDESEQALHPALDKALLRHSAGIASGTGSGTAPIDKQGTKKPRTKKKEAPVLDFPFSGERFMELWATAIEMKKWKKKSVSAHEMTLKELAKYSEAVACRMLEKAIAGDWQGVFALDDREIRAIDTTTPAPNGKYVRVDRKIGWAFFEDGTHITLNDEELAKIEKGLLV